MTRTSTLLGAVSAVALVALSSSPALAEGTDAGTAITNEVSVTFEVNGIEQTVEEATDEFVVDRKVNMTVVEVGDAATLVTPGSVSQVTTFEVTNLANDTLDFALGVAQQSGGAGAHAGTDSFDVTDVTIYIDDDGTAGFSAGDSEITYIDGLEADETATIFVVSSVPLSLSNGQISTVTLSATAHGAGATGALGTLLETSATNVVDEVDTVLADGIGATDGEYDGVFSAQDDYQVQAAALSVLKTSVIVEDFVSGVGEEPKAIPGATVRYCIAVTNGAGAQTASNIAISDILPTTVELITGSIRVNGTTEADGSCNTDGVAGGSFDGTRVTGSLDDIAAGETLTLLFDATIR